MQALFNQELEPGQGPRTETIASREKAAEEKLQKEQEVADERARKAAEDKLNEAGKNPNGAPPGEGAVGDIVGSIPIDQAGEFVDPAETVRNLDRRQRAAKQKQQQATTTCRALDPVLARREKLRAAGDHCVDRLTVSHLADHSAREVCEMPHSWGPDFMAVPEGFYCNMCEHALYPLCRAAQQQDCFDVAERALRARGDRAERPSKSYVDVQVWRA